MLDHLKSGLIVSCQPVKGGPMDRPEIVEAFSLAAISGGAVGLRIEGIENLRPVRARVKTPIIGLIKRNIKDYPIYITPDFCDIDALAESGADIIAIDATCRPRPRPLTEMVERIKSHGKLAMADCSCIEDGRLALEAGADILGTTLSGYVEAPPPREPDFKLTADLSRFCTFTIAEGRITSPELARQAILAGADAVVVGSAITRTEHVTSWFSSAIQNGARNQNMESS